MTVSDLSKAKKVIVSYSEQRTNELITKGWKLINTASGKDESGYPIIKYSLAWFLDSDPQE